MQGNVLGQAGGGLKINGIIQEYKVASGGKIRAGDFVKFVNGEGDGTIGTDTQLSTKSYSGCTHSAVQIDTNKVFIAHKGDSSSYLYGIVCTINETTITVGVDTKISTISNSGERYLAVQIDTNKVFISHSSDNSTGSYDYLYGIVCTIEGTTITTGTDKKIGANSTTGYSNSIIKLDTDKVFIIHTGGGVNSSNYPYGIVCTINNTTITTGTDTRLSSRSYSGYDVSKPVQIDTNKLFITYGSDSYVNSTNYLYGLVFTIEGTTITTGIDKRLSTVVYSGHNPSIMKLDTDKVLITHGSESISKITNYLYGIICTIERTIIKNGSDIKLSTIGYSGYSHSAIQIDTNKVLITHGSNTNGNSTNYLYGMICTINNTTITVEIDTQLSTVIDSGYSPSIIKIDTDKIFIVHKGGTNSHLYKIVCTVEGTSITAGTDTELCTIDNSGYRYSIVQIGTNELFVLHSSGENDTTNYLYGIGYMKETIVNEIKTLTDKICGIAKTKGTEGQTVKVYIPKLPEYICTEDENRIISENGEEIRNE